MTDQPGKTGGETGWSRGGWVCTPIAGALASPFRARPWNQTEKGTLALHLTDGIPSPRLSPGKELPIVFRPRVPSTGCVTIFLGRVTITFLSGPQVLCLTERTHLGPYL